MGKKGSMELSVNSIVILVIAVVMMGLILGFIRSQILKAQDQFPTNENDPTPASGAEQITFSRPLTMGAGEKIPVKISTFNSFTSATDQYVYPYIVCKSGSNGPSFTLSTTAAKIASGDSHTFQVLLKAGNAAKDQYLCTACAYAGGTAEKVNVLKDGTPSGFKVCATETVGSNADKIDLAASKDIIVTIR